MKYEISMHVPGMPFDGDTIKTKSLGGSESAGYFMARELARLGNRVTVFSNCEAPGVYDDVIYRPAGNWLTYSTTTQHDVQIVQRAPQCFQHRLASRLNWLWCHDLALGRATNELRGVLWNVDKLVMLSQFMYDQYKLTHDLKDNLLLKSRNGLDLSLFPNQGWLSRRPKQLVFAARPERGLDNLLDLFGKLLERDPEFQLLLCGYDNPVEHMQAFYAALSEKAKTYGEAVQWAGTLSKEQLYKLYSQAWLYVYPTPSPLLEQFDEISCISVMEAQAAGLPVVSSNRGALPETLSPEAGILVDGLPWEEDYQERFVDAILELTNNKERWQKASEVGREHAQNLGWSHVAEQWQEEIDRCFAELNDSPRRLAHYFYKNNDIFAARKVLERNKDAAPELEREIREKYWFADNEDLLKDHYRQNGERTAEHLGQLPIESWPQFQQSEERRFHVLTKHLSQLAANSKILEYGCGHGWSTIYLHNKTGHRWTGIDIDPGAIEWCNKFKAVHAKLPDALNFMEADYRALDLLADGSYDCALLTEVLEHCIDPFTVIETVERKVKPGGKIFITVPYGPSEFGTPNWDNFRNHLWNFELKDLNDLFAAKKNMGVDAAPERFSEALGDVVGFHIIFYEADQQPLGKLDWERKLRLQRPRHTLSGSLIGGPNCEETLDWCLKSIYPICDEIVIGDTGLSEPAKMIAAKYEAKVVPAPDPNQVGFDEARNASLDACTMDFVLWIDTDERLVGTPNVTKYLRESCWAGFGIRQHHFTVDAGFKPDMPVRLFRRRKNEKGEDLKFVGAIHEHPEFGVNEGPGEVIILADVHVAHVGYLNEEIRRRRFIRNRPLLDLDKKKYPDRKLQKHFIIRDNCLLNTYELQQNGGVPTDAIKARCKEVCDLYRKHFLGQPGYLNIDTLQYYTQALQVLGEGVDVYLDLRTHRDGVGDNLNAPPQPMLVRFASIEEAEKEVAWRLKDKMKPLLPKYW